MKKMLLSLTALALLGSTAQARTWADIQKSGTIKIATEGAFPPFNLMKGKTPTGFEVELAEVLAKQLGLKVQWTIQPFDSLLIGLNQDRYDFVIASHGITPERQKAVDFSNPHYCTGGAIVTRPGGPLTAKALSGKSVAVQVGGRASRHHLSGECPQGARGTRREDLPQGHRRAGGADGGPGGRLGG